MATVKKFSTGLGLMLTKHESLELGIWNIKLRA